jgi:hypothetical protein
MPDALICYPGSIEKLKLLGATYLLLKNITSHYSHKICLHIQGSKQQQYLQDKHGWSNKVWDSIYWKELKGAFLSPLGPRSQAN